MYVLCGYICCKENCPWFFSIREQDHVEKGEVDTRAAYVADVWQRGFRQTGGRAKFLPWHVNDR